MPAPGEYGDHTRSHFSSRTPISRRLTLAALALGFIGLMSFLVLEDSNRGVYRTPAGQRTQITLADGSTMTLAPYSRVTVRFEERQRSVQLDHGEALFHVAKDAQRPFIVQVESTRVRAVGTLFDVGRNSAGIVVTVVEGRVTVSAAAAPDLPKVSVGENQQLLRTGGTSQLRQVDAPAEVAWTTGELVFHDETVNEVVDRFNRYNEVKIRVLDTTTGARRVSGNFVLSDPQSFVAFVNSVGGTRGQALLELSQSTQQDH
jgi:transmembrane sensor